MKNELNFYCYSLRLYHFLCAFGQKCYISKINASSKNRYWVFRKSKELDRIIDLYNEIKHKIS